MNWSSIWAARPILSDTPDLAELIACDGFDRESHITQEYWLQYVLHVAEKLELGNTQHVLEVGCGSGAFIWPLYQRGLLVSGIDFSAPLITAAKQMMPKGDFYLSEANQPFPGGKVYDAIISNSVFQYFPDLLYTQHVLQHMGASLKPGGKIAILDVVNEATLESCHRGRTTTPGDDVSLAHLSFAKNFFLKQFPSPAWKVTIEDQHIPQYQNSPFRYNVYIDHLSLDALEQTL